jgi:serine/threonine-protein kinase
MASDDDKTLTGNTHSADAPNRRKIGHYEIVAELGRGGMGTVYRAYENSLNRYVAIKELAPHLAGDQELIARFAREAKSVAALNHPNIVHIYYTGDDNGLPYFVMECIEGDTIADLLAQGGVFESKQAANMMLQAAKGLAAAHQRGIIHRDIKPSNLMVDAAGTVKIADFGIALARDIGGDNLTTTGHFVGTTGYISPEIFKGHTVDARSDIFSLGVVLFEMLAGRKPFDDDSPMGQMLQVVEQPAPELHELNPEVHTKLQQILARMIAKQPEQRYQDCDELANDLRHYLADEPLEANATGHHAHPRPSRRGWLLLPLLLLATGAAGYWWRAPLSAALQNTASQFGLTDNHKALEVAAEPNQEPSTVKNEPSAPNQEPSAPNQEPSAPNQEPSAPNQEPTAINQQPTAPNKALSTTVLEPSALNQEPSAPNQEPSASTPKPLVAHNLSAKDGSAPTNSVRPATPKATTATHRAAGNNQASNPTHTVMPTSQPVSATQQPAAPAPTATVMVIRGDPQLAGTLRQMLTSAAHDRGLTLLDHAFIAELEQTDNAGALSLAKARQPVLHAGGRYLIIANATTLEAEALEYYGQHDTLYTANITLTGYDLLQRQTLGSWSKTVRYTSLNASSKTRTAAYAMINELVGSF